MEKVVTQKTFENMIQMIKEEPVLFKDSVIKFGFREDDNSGPEYYLCRKSNKIDLRKYLSNSSALKLFKKKSLSASLFAEIQEELFNREKVFFVRINNAKKEIDFFPVQLVFFYFKHFFDKDKDSVFVKTVNVDTIIEKLDNIQNETI